MNQQLTVIKHQHLNKKQRKKVPPTFTSAVTGRPPFKKRKKKEPDMDAELMSKLKEILGTKKDEAQLYGDFLAEKLRKLTKLNKIRVKHENDNI